MIKKIALILILIVALYSLYKCVFESGRWTQIHGSGLASDHETLSTMCFISTTSGFIGGSNWQELPESSARAMLVESKSVIFKTEDGGASWERTDLSKGEVQQIEYADGVLFAVVRVHSEGSFRNLHSELWASYDSGKIWQKICTTSQPISIIKLLFKDTKTGVAIFDEEHEGKSNWFFAKTVNGGRTWNKSKVNSEALPTGFMSLLANGFAYLSNNAVYYSELPDIKPKMIFRKEGNYFPKIATDRQMNLWLIEKLDNRLELLKVDREFKVKNISVGKNVTAANPFTLHVDGDSISLILYGGHSILGVDHVFYHTNDGGASWRKEKIPFSLIASPSAFYGQDNVWLGGGVGSVQVRK